MKKLSLVFILLSMSGISFGACPRADLTGDCEVNLEDFAIMASEWMDIGEPLPVLNGMVFVTINDPGVPGHEAFNGEMSRYETTNAQYCEYLNAALASNDIRVEGSNVIGASGPYSWKHYYNFARSGINSYGAINGGAARINWTGSSFTVDSGFDNHPVTHVTWYGSSAFASYYGYRLPTEWEWQAVADYTVADPYKYGCGNGINNSIANIRDSTHPDGTTIVGSFGAYGYEMCNMASNVSEWTSSLYDSASGDLVVRGGGWTGGDIYCSVGRRSKVEPDETHFGFLGFRVCR
jgi:formylglycine-generating enzyme required for sulfatase activity